MEKDAENTKDFSTNKRWKFFLSLKSRMQFVHGFVQLLEIIVSAPHHKLK
jgi:hypothetical protein